MGFRVVWSCDVCGDEKEELQLYELKAYNLQHVYVCPGCLGSRLIAVALRNPKQMKED